MIIETIARMEIEDENIIKKMVNDDKGLILLFFNSKWLFLFFFFIYIHATFKLLIIIHSKRIFNTNI